MKHMLVLLLAVLLPMLRAEETISLEKAWDLALRDSPSFEASRERLQQAEARWRQARSANQPRLGLEAGGTRVDYRENQQILQPGMEDSADQFRAALQASWLLLDGGTRGQNIRAARLGAEVGEANLGQARQQLLGAVARAYFATQLAREAMRIATADAAFNARQFEEARLRHDAGRGTHADTLNFEIRMNSASTTVATARSEWTASTAALAALIAWENQASEPVPQALAAEIPELATPGGEPALEERPDLRALRGLIEQSKASARAVRGEYLPELRLNGGVEALREDDPDFASGDVGSNVGIALSVDLWDGASRKQRVKEAWAKVREAEAEYAQALLDARAEYRAAIATLEANRHRLRLSERNRALAEENRNLIEMAYRAGSETLLRLNEAQRDLTTAESQAALARIQVNNAEIALRLAAGTPLVAEETRTER
jgi:outer membrane protein